LCIKTNCDGYKEEEITYPLTIMQSTSLMEIYNECGIPTSCLDYVEAHGTSTKVSDPQEINAIHIILFRARVLARKIIQKNRHQIFRHCL